MINQQSLSHYGDLVIFKGGCFFMNILGIGVDIQEVEWFENLPLDFFNKKVNRIFSRMEIISCTGKENPHIHLSGKFAAKEAVIKSLSIGRNEGLVLSDIEILSRDSGEPVCNLSGRPAEILNEIGGKGIMISISHTNNNSVAVAISYS